MIRTLEGLWYGHAVTFSSAFHTSYCKTNKYFIKVPLIIDGGHLAAVLCCVWSSGVEDQNVGRLSELSSVLQVPFWRTTEREREMGGWKTLYNCSFKYTAWLHGLKTEFWAKVFQGSIHSAKLWVLRLCFETLCSTGFSKRQFPRGLPAILFWKYT